MSDGTTTRRIRDRLEELRMAATDHQGARASLVGEAYDRLILLARKMLRDYTLPGEETGAIVSGAYQRLERALTDPDVIARMTTPRDFLRVAALQIRRELLDLSRKTRREFNQRSPVPVSDAPATDGPRAVAIEESNVPEVLASWSEFHEAVGALPEQEREVFEAVWYSGLKKVEVAEMLDVDEKTIRVRLMKAQRSLHDALGGELPF